MGLCRITAVLSSAAASKAQGDARYVIRSEEDFGDVAR